MAQITLDWIASHRRLIEDESKKLEGAYEMLKIVEEQLNAEEKDALTMDDLKGALGADSVEVIEKGGE